MQGFGRSVREVFEDHLRERQHGFVEADLERNYAEGVVVLTRWGTLRGHDGLRQLAARLRRELPNVTFEYGTRIVEGEFAFLEWKARSDGAKVEDGADSFCVRNGRIVMQSIHYTVEPLRKLESIEAA